MNTLSLAVKRPHRFAPSTLRISVVESVVGALRLISVPCRLQKQLKSTTPLRWFWSSCISVAEGVLIVPPALPSGLLAHLPPVGRLAVGSAGAAQVGCTQTHCMKAALTASAAARCLGLPVGLLRLAVAMMLLPPEPCLPAGATGRV